MGQVRQGRGNIFTQVSWVGGVLKIHILFSVFLHKKVASDNPMAVARLPERVPTLLGAPLAHANLPWTCEERQTHFGQGKN